MLFLLLCWAAGASATYPVLKHKYSGAQNQSDAKVVGVTATYLKHLPIKMDAHVGVDVSAASATLFAVGSNADYAFIVALGPDGWYVAQTVHPITGALANSGFGLSLYFREEMLLVGAAHDGANSPNKQTSDATATDPRCGTVHVFRKVDDAYVPLYRMAPPSTAMSLFGGQMSATSTFDIVAIAAAGSAPVTASPVVGAQEVGPATNVAGGGSVVVYSQAEGRFGNSVDVGGVDRSSAVVVVGHPLAGVRPTCEACNATTGAVEIFYIGAAGAAAKTAGAGGAAGSANANTDTTTDGKGTGAGAGAGANTGTAGGKPDAAGGGTKQRAREAEAFATVEEAKAAAAAALPAVTAGGFLEPMWPTPNEKSPGFAARSIPANLRLGHATSITQLADGTFVVAASAVADPFCPKGVAPETFVLGEYDVAGLLEPESKVCNSTGSVFVWRLGTSTADATMVTYIRDVNMTETSTAFGHDLEVIAYNETLALVVGASAAFGQGGYVDPLQPAVPEKARTKRGVAGLVTLFKCALKEMGAKKSMNVSGCARAHVLRPGARYWYSSFGLSVGLAASDNALSVIAGAPDDTAGDGAGFIERSGAYQIFLFGPPPPWPTPVGLALLISMAVMALLFGGIVAIVVAYARGATFFGLLPPPPVYLHAVSAHDGLVWTLGDYASVKALSATPGKLPASRSSSVGSSTLYSYHSGSDSGSDGGVSDGSIDSYNAAKPSKKDTRAPPLSGAKAAGSRRPHHADAMSMPVSASPTKPLPGKASRKGDRDGRDARDGGARRGGATVNGLASITSSSRSSDPAFVDAHQARRSMR